MLISLNVRALLKLPMPGTYKKRARQACLTVRRPAGLSLVARAPTEHETQNPVLEFKREKTNAYEGHPREQ